jgi:tetraacyldisaccharide 4'-kinase
MSAIERHWYRHSLLSAALLPLAWIYCLLVLLRRGLYRLGLLRVERLPVPVVVVGNLTVGGTGKTPLVIWLARFLADHGFRPGIVTRGYRGQSAEWPRQVLADSDPRDVGDEPVLLARRAGCPVMADPDRARGAHKLVADHGCTVIVSDDGLQHYRLGRDIEIAVIDGARRFGNGHCLPAGPLREPVWRLRSVDARVTLGDPAPGEWGMRLVNSGLQTPTGVLPPDAWKGVRVHAVAGIGHPARFFDQLRGLGMEVIEHPFPDHHAYRPEDYDFEGEEPVLMTEKDAVKCERLKSRPFSFLRVEARPDPRLGNTVLHRLKEVARG